MIFNLPAQSRLNPTHHPLPLGGGIIRFWLEADFKESHQMEIKKNL